MISNQNNKENITAGFQLYVRNSENHIRYARNKLKKYLNDFYEIFWKILKLTCLLISLFFRRELDL